MSTSRSKNCCRRCASEVKPRAGRLNIKRSNEFPDRRYAGLFERAGQLIQQPCRNFGVVIVGGTDLHGAGSRDQELHYVVESGNPADPNDWDVDGAGDLMHTAQRDRFNRRPA